MPVIAYRNFAGEIPRTEPALLPADRAQSAVNCLFDSGALKPTRAGLPFRTMQSNPVRGLFTEDGNLFYSWPTETHAFRAPIFNDEFNRMYFLPVGGGWRVATKLGMAIDGPQPPESWLAGVPRPTAAPVLSLVDRTTLPDYPNVTVSAKAWFVDSFGDKHNEADAALVPVVPFKEYQVTPTSFPAPEVDKPVLHIRISVTDNDNEDNQVFAITTRLDSYATGGTSDRATSSSVPGSVEAWIESSGGSTFSLKLQWGLESTRAYTYTFRNSWEEEGPAADPATISPTYLQDVRVEVSPGSFVGYRPFLEYQVYRTYGGNPTYIEVDTTPLSATAFLDESHGNTGAMGAALESVDWIPAQDNLSGAVESPNGWFAAFKGAFVYVSQPYRPHAWPYYFPFPTLVRGIEIGQDAIIVTTADGLYALIGSHPAAMQPVKINQPQPGVAQRSMAQIDGSVAYASHDGIILVNGTTATTALNQKLFTREKWRERVGASLDDASLMFNFHDGVLVAMSRERTSGFLLRLDEDIGALSTYDRRYDGMFLLPVTDTLFYSIGNQVYRFGAGALEQLDWHGKDHILAARSFFAIGYIRCDGPTTITLYGNGVQQSQKTVAGTGYFRIPGRKRFLRWSVRVSSANKVHELYVATSKQELAGG